MSPSNVPPLSWTCLIACCCWTVASSSTSNVTRQDYFPDDYTAHSYEHINSTRDGRIFQFTSKDSKMRLELSFAIPFVEIPVVGSGKYASYASGQSTDPLVNVNLGALASAGILASVAILFVPNLFNGIAPQVLFGRSLDGQPQSRLAGVMSRLSQELHANNIDSTVCTQKAVCWAVRQAGRRVDQGKGASTSLDKIVDGVTSNPWLTTLLRGTTLLEAIQSGRNDTNCNEMYSKCYINEKIVQNALRHFMKDL